MRVGAEEASIAARWLKENLGLAPDLAVVLGSGLSPETRGRPAREGAYSAIPQWVCGSVQGHPQSLLLSEIDGRRAVFLKGRPHEYEGYDLSEVKLPVRTLATWGVRKLILTTASGGVARDLIPGSIVMVTEVLDLQYSAADGGPARLCATEIGLAEALERGGAGLRKGAHASLPGPQYETPAELDVLLALAASTVSMSPAAELRAARDECLDVAVIAVVVNSGDTTHADVLEGSARASDSLRQTLAAVAAAWETASLY